jgi:hypothetical protein
MNEIQCRMYRPDGTRCTLAPGHTEEEGPHGARDPRTDPQPGDALIIPKGSGVNAGRYVVDDRWIDRDGVAHVGYTAGSGFVGCSARYTARLDQWAEWMVGAVVPVTTTRIPAGEITFEGGITIPFEPGDLSFKAEDYHADDPKKPLDLSGSFTASLRDLDIGGFLAALTKPEVWTTTAAYTLTVTYTRPRNPPIGELRAWARTVSSTPWRRRSIASWRWLWRRTMLDTRSATFENVAINSGDGDTLTIETCGPVQRYDVVMYGKHA